MTGPTSQSPIHRFPGRWRDPSQFRDEVASGHMPAVSCSSCLRVFPRSWRPMGTICWASSFVATESGAFRINSNTTKVLWATFGLCCVFFFVGCLPTLASYEEAENSMSISVAAKATWNERKNPTPINLRYCQGMEFQGDQPCINTLTTDDNRLVIWCNMQ